MLRTCDRMVVMRDGGKVGEKLGSGEMNRSQPVYQPLRVSNMKNDTLKKITSRRLFPADLRFLPRSGIAGECYHNTELFAISVRDGVLYGYIIDIINRAEAGNP